MRGSRILVVAGAVVFVAGMALETIGVSSDPRIPRVISLLMLLAGLISLAMATVIGLRDRRRTANASDVPQQEIRERRRAFFVRLTVWGLVLVPVSLVIARVAGNGASIFVYAPPAVFALVLAIVVRTTGRAFVPALVVGILLFLIFSMLSQSELTHPESFADFVPAFWRFAGTGIAVVAAFVAMRQRRKGTLHRATPRERTAVRVGAIALIAVSAGSFVLDRASRTTIARADGAVVVNSLRDSFDPETIHVEKGRVLFLIRNDDSYAHTFSIDELELDQYVAPRSDRLVTVTFGHKGTYELYCAVTGHEDMTGEIEAG